MKWVFLLWKRRYRKPYIVTIVSIYGINMDKTTIQINFETLERLKALKHYDRQPYDELILNLIDNVDEETLSIGEIEDIKIALENVKKGKIKPIEQVARELGITLR